MEVLIIKKNYTWLCLLILLMACDSKPRVIEAQATQANASVERNKMSALQEATQSKAVTSGTHQVLVEEVLNTEKYTYLHVLENEEKHWIAIPRMDIKVGEKYSYSGGLLKRNFFSREYDRVFETIYLVSKIWKSTGLKKANSAIEEALARSKATEGMDLKVGNIKPATGAITLAELMDNKAKYGNQTVKVTGKVVKINPKIMSRNWVHLQDGSGDKLDLTITTALDIPLGAVLSLEGTIVLDKDFGAGYRYDIIMENAVMK